MTSPLHDRRIRSPILKDYLLFFVGLPFGLAAFFAAFGIRLTVGMPFLDSFIYLFLHIIGAWWGIALGSYLIYVLFRQWQPPATINIVVGFFLMLIPLTFYYQYLGDYYAVQYPSFAEARQEAYLPSWSLAYLLHYLRFSIPALPLFLVGAYSFKVLRGVDWFGYGLSVANVTEHKSAAEQATTDGLMGTAKPTAAILDQSKLPTSAELIAIKAEEHYIHIWSDQGTDLIRYRFADIVEDLRPYTGMQVHRSWWVNLSGITRTAKKGRSFELIMSNDLQVPVSLAYKQAVSNVLEISDGA